MANKKLWFGILVMTLVFGFIVIACNGNKIEGTWYFPEDEIKFIFEKGKVQILEDDEVWEEGTYTINGNKLKFSGIDDSDFEDDMKFSIDGNTLTLFFDDEPFTGTRVAGSSAKNNNKSDGKASAVVKQYYAALAKGDAKTIGKVMTAKGAQNITPFMSKAKDHVDALGKITKTEEIINGNSGVVKVMFSNGATEEIDVIKVDGKWKISEWDRGIR
ncbi:DUF5640 domain-containing protein [Treponema sp. R6D11]